MRDVGSVNGRRPAGLSDSVDKRPSEEGSSPVDIVTTRTDTTFGCEGDRCSAFYWSADGAYL